MLAVIFLSVVRQRHPVATSFETINHTGNRKDKTNKFEIFINNALQNLRNARPTHRTCFKVQRYCRDKSGV